jgi:hypothetical protein
MSSPRKLTCNGTSRQVLICCGPEAITPSLTHEEGEGEGVELNQREGRWAENTNTTDCISSL